MYKLHRGFFSGCLGSWRFVSLSLNPRTFFANGAAVELFVRAITVWQVGRVLTLTKVGIARFFGGKGFRFKFSTYVRAITKGLGLRQATHAKVIFLAFF